MESPPAYMVPPHSSDASRPSLGFPLGTALLLIVIFSLSGIFSCCYHWEKLRSLRRSFSQDADNDDPEAAAAQWSPQKAKPAFLDLKAKEFQTLPVLMPGDDVPKFIAMPCPCEPPRQEKVIVKVEKPPKPPRFPVPLY